MSGTISLYSAVGDTHPVRNFTINSSQFIVNQSNPYYSISFSITSSGNVFLNSMNGDVGSLSNPIVINATGTITVGGKLAAIESTENSTILADSSNPPSAIYLNGKAVV